MGLRVEAILTLFVLDAGRLPRKEGQTSANSRPVEARFGDRWCE
jgi:hypothetical protein